MSQPSPNDVYREVAVAETLIRPHIRETFLEPSPELTRMTGADVYLKLENQQITGSFKLRGALAKILALPKDGAEVLAASTGNHAMAIAYALRLAGRKGAIYLPERVPAGKLNALRALGARFEQFGEDPVEAESKARRDAESSGKIYVSPYNDLQVIGGQGTVGVELSRQIPDAEAVFVAVGGGGLIAGIAAHMKRDRPGIEVVGCLPANSPVMMECVKAGRIIPVKSRPTLSDATAGALEPGAITFELCRRLVDRYFLVSESEIRSAMVLLARSHHLLVEGSAAVAVAAFLRESPRYRGRKVVLLLCGGNVDLETARQVLCAN